MASPTCFFNCGNSDKKLVCGGKNRIETIINSSIQRHDLYHIDLQSMLDNNPNVTIHFHNACVTTYNSKIHMKRYQKKNSSLDTSSQQTPPKQLRCHYSFNFREHCLICGDLCLEKSAKNPGRHKKVVRCRTVHIKDNLIKVCEQRGDSHAVEVSSRITCAITDLHAADARYHQTCFTTFVSSRNIAAAVASTSKQQKPDPVNLAFSCVIRLLKSDPGKLWNSVELYDVYSQSLKAAEGFEYGDEGQNNADANNTGQRCARSSLIQRLQEHFGECLIVLRTEGCANIIAFRKHVSEKLKLVEANDDDNISDLANVDINNPHIHLIGDTNVYQHEEADVKIISYLLQICPHHKHVQVLADDADIFVLLVYFIWYYKPLAYISMRKYNGKIIDITATVAKLGNKCSDILPVHALSGCDTVSYPYGKGKVSVINLMLKLDLDLSVFADSNSEEGKWMAAGICFLSLLYGGECNGVTK